MDFKNVNNTPAQAAPQPSSVRSSSAGDKGSQGKKPNTWMMIVGVVVLVALVACGLWWALSGKSGNGEAAIDRDAYQAVFLTNGQVYFGKLQSTAGKYASMENIYYLQVEQSVQPSTENPAKEGNADNNVQLIKLGNELHGPEDKMQISSDQILFWENLKEDSKISKAISEYKD